MYLWSSSLSLSRPSPTLDFRLSPRSSRSDLSSRDSVPRTVTKRSYILQRCYQLYHHSHPSGIEALQSGVRIHAAGVRIPHTNYRQTPCNPPFVPLSGVRIPGGWSSNPAAHERGCEEHARTQAIPQMPLCGPWAAVDRPGVRARAAGRRAQGRQATHCVRPWGRGDWAWLGIPRLSGSPDSPNGWECELWT